MRLGRWVSCPYCDDGITKEGSGCGPFDYSECVVCRGEGGKQMWEKEEGDDDD